jgi:hypothetical protein
LEKKDGNSTSLGKKKMAIPHHLEKEKKDGNSTPLGEKKRW